MTEPTPTTRPEDEETRVLVSTEVGRALSAAGFGDVHVLSHEAADRALTKNRRELISVITREPIESIRGLARRVGRDKGNVKRDLDVLVEENLVEFVTDGRSKRPAIKPDTIIQEPLVNPAVVSDEP